MQKINATVALRLTEDWLNEEYIDKAIFVAEVRVVDPEQCRTDRTCLAGAVPLCRPSRKLMVQEAVGVGVELLVLPINSALTWLAPLAGSAPGHLIAVVSHWQEFIETAQTML